MIPQTTNLDIELTNRCNADCYFCPRDQTPHQGIMSAETFEKTLQRAIEYRDHSLATTGRDLNISLCGLGEPLLNPRAVESARMVVDAGFRCAVTSNGSVLTEAKARGLLDAGIHEIDLNVGEEGEEYERIYGLPFERTLENVVRFAEMADGRCTVNIVLVDHREDESHREHMQEFWRSKGLGDFVIYPVMNRGGALQVERMVYDDDLAHVRTAKDVLANHSSLPICMAPFVFLFVGYDGKYYLCCADWKKEASYGTVHDTSIVETLGPKLRAARGRELVCHTCNVDPTNVLADAIRSADTRDDGEIAVAIQAKLIEDDSKDLEALVDALAPGTSTDPSFELPASARRRIPVRTI